MRPAFDLAPGCGLCAGHGFAVGIGHVGRGMGGAP